MTTTTPYRFGGRSAIVLAVLALLAALLTLLLDTPPTNPEELLRYLSRLTTQWSIIAGLSIVADLLIPAVAYALYRALRKDAGNLALAGCGLLALFAFLDLAVRWPNFVALITLAGPWADATTTEIEALIGAAGHATAILRSFLLPVYVTLIPGIGILLAGVAWSRAELGRGVAWVGLAVGVLALITILAGAVGAPPTALMIASSAATALWFGIVGYALLRLDPT